MEVIATFCPQPNLSDDPQIGFWEVGAPQAPKTLSSLMGFNPEIGSSRFGQIFQFACCLHYRIRFFSDLGVIRGCVC
jgi:hypothetical protein